MTKKLNPISITPEQRVALCQKDIVRVLEKYNCQLLGEAQVVKTSRFRMWILQRLASGRIRVEIKLQDNSAKK